jgi:hypothetical protein
MRYDVNSFINFFILIKVSDVNARWVHQREGDMDVADPAESTRMLYEAGER